MKKDYVIVSKKVSTLGSFVGKSKTFPNKTLLKSVNSRLPKG